MADRIQATYHIETAHPLTEAAEAMAGEERITRVEPRLDALWPLVEKGRGGTGP
jgi:hypothetical protein